MIIAYSLLVTKLVLMRSVDVLRRFLKEEKMKNQVMEREVTTKKIKNGDFDYRRLVSNEDFCRNLNAILAYYQMSKGEAKKRFVSR